MILIGESINIMSQTIGPAMKERNPGPIQAMAKAETEAGADYLDLNIGPARKAGDEFMEWMVKTVQEVSNLPLSLDTTNLDAMEAGLKACKGKVLMNSVSLQPERLEKGLKLAKDYGADLIGLLWGVEGMPRDANERAVLAVDIVYKANEMGIPSENIWIDPIVTPISVEINQVKACVEFTSMIGDIAPGCNSTIGCSNISNGTPIQLRPWLNRTYLVMLKRYGLHSAIVDVFDKDMVAIGRDKRPDIEEVVHRVMDGENLDPSSLTEELRKYYKTAKVLTGETLYSHSWLEA
ncbi:MAG: dihydropteroate synthase [Dehalococcoidales bacterium]|jgi:cobalamin-dependent methionine synthase I